MADETDQLSKFAAGKKHYRYYRQPPQRKKGPEIKHTKTSLQRLKLVNPILAMSVNVGSGNSVAGTLPSNPSSRFRTDTFSTLDFDVAGTSSYYSSMEEVMSIISQPQSCLWSQYTISGGQGTVGSSFSVSSIPKSTSVKQLPQFDPALVVEPRSIKRVPSSPEFLRNKRFFVPSIYELRARLSAWMEKNNKNVRRFTHLCHFMAVSDENKENIGLNAIASDDDDSYENLGIDQDQGAFQLNKLKCDNEIICAKSAMLDIKILAKDGFDPVSCLQWLDLIVEKLPQLKEDSKYWICKATIEEIQGNSGVALENYQKAIIYGEESSGITYSLKRLIKKFSTLSTDVDKGQKKTRNAQKKIEHGQQVFQSSVIKMALEQKKILKSEKEKVLVATPVRRSTRPNESLYSKTPNAILVDNLNQIDEETRKKVQLRENKALL